MLYSCCRRRAGPGSVPGPIAAMLTGVPGLPICPMLGSMANESTGTGVVELDRALDGLYWGDNVVWVWEASEAASQGLVYDAIARRREDFDKSGYVVASSDPAEVRKRWPWIEPLDARRGTPLSNPRRLL